MLPTHAGHLTVVLVAVLALTAGCQSPGGTTPTEGTTATPAEETPPTETNEPANSSAPSLFERHERTIRRAGNVTVERSSVWTTDYNGSSILLESGSTTRADFESGRVYRLQQSSIADTSAVYRNETGAVFSLVGGRFVSGPEWNNTLRLDESLGPFPADESRLQSRGQGTVDGVTGTVYVLDDYEALESSPGRTDPDNVTAFRTTYVVDDRGYVAYARMNYTVERNGSATAITATARTKAVGSTTVERPAWLDGRTDTTDPNT